MRAGRVWTRCGVLAATGLLALTGAMPAHAAPDRIDGSSRASVIAAYREWLSPTLLVPVGWTGSVDGCDRGTTSPAGRAATLSAVNYMRAMADLEPVTLDRGMSGKAQAAALIMTANEMLDHTPPKSARCWTKAGYAGASHGNLSISFGYEGTDGQEPLSPATGARAITSYMDDPGGGNEIVGHRRWILYQQLRRIGTGDTTSANSLYVIDGYHAPSGTTWVPWPTAGYFPRELEPEGRWSLSYPGADFSKAKVAVTTPDGGVRVTRHRVADGYADNTLSWDMALPAALSPAEDYPVTVAVTGIRLPGGRTVAHRWTTTLVTASTP